MNGYIKAGLKAVLVALVTVAGPIFIANPDLLFTNPKSFIIPVLTAAAHAYFNLFKDAPVKNS